MRIAAPVGRAVQRGERARKFTRAHRDSRAPGHALRGDARHSGRHLALSASGSSGEHCQDAADGGRGGGSYATPRMSREQWNRLTDRLVVLSSIPFSVLVLPQVLQNGLAMSHGNAAALSIISWEGYLSGLLGNTLMCTHFASRGERSAVNVQLIGILNNMLVLSQVAMAAYMPLSVFIPTAMLICFAVSISTWRLKQSGPAADTADEAGAHANESTSSSMSVWGGWQLVSGVCGLSVIPQVMANLMVPGQLGLMPGLGTALLLAAYFAFQLRDNNSRRALKPVIAQMPGWGATLLFALSPLPQLVRNFLEPQSLEGLSLGTMLLALLGNSLMFPRALFVRDPVWLAGATWAIMAGWGQLLSMKLGTAPATGTSYLSTAPFVVVTLALVGYLAYALSCNALFRAKSVESVWQDLKQ